MMRFSLSITVVNYVINPRLFPLRRAALVQASSAGQVDEMLKRLARATPA